MPVYHIEVILLSYTFGEIWKKKLCLMLCFALRRIAPDLCIVNI